MRIIDEEVVKSQRKNRGYWALKENRIKELKNYLDSNYYSIDGLSDKYKRLYSAIYEYDGSVNKLLSDMDIRWDDVCSISNKNFYRDFKNVESKIRGFISENNRFPTKDEISKTLGIHQRNIDFHGGMNEVKRKMNYFNKDDLVDDNGFVNKSSLEYIVAQYLIHNGIAYMREQFPFANDGYYRSDFTIESLCDEIFHVEVWGYSENSNGELNKKYNSIKREKIRLYKKYNLNLIALEYDSMTKKSLDDIQNYLDEKFSVIQNLKFKKVNNDLLLTPSHLTDKEILDIIMKYSEDENILPSFTLLTEKGLGSFCREIRKRYGDYFNFASLVNKQLQNQKFKWDQETIYTSLLEIVKENKPIKKETLKEKGFMGMMNKQDKNGSHSLIPVRLDFYQKYVCSGGKYIHPEDIDFLNKVVKNVGANVKNKVTKEQQEQAEMILQIYRGNVLINAI